MNSNVKQIIKAINMIMYTKKNEIVELLERFFFLKCMRKYPNSEKE